MRVRRREGQSIDSVGDHKQVTMDLPTADSIVRLHAELLLIISLCQKRNRGGRHNKHDTARLRYIKGTGLRWLRFGKLVPDNDLRMMKLGQVLHPRPALTPPAE